MSKWLIYRDADFTAPQRQTLAVSVLGTGLCGVDAGACGGIPHWSLVKERGSALRVVEGAPVLESCGVLLLKTQ